MDLIERYLASIGPLLPRGQRADILAELREALLGRREEKEAELGRPLTRDEDVALVRGFGNPLVVAGRYGSQQYLIGPEIYPLYIFALKVLVAIVAAGAVVNGLVQSAIGPGQPGPALVSALAVMWNGTITSVGVLTIIAAVMQRQRIPLRFLTDWNPADLPRPARVRRPRRQTALDHVGVLIWTVVFILWWTRLLPIWIPYISYIPLKAGEQLTLARAPIWETLFWPVLGVAIVALVVHGAKLVWSRRGFAADALDVLRQVAVVAIAGLALRAGRWVDISGTGLSAKALADIDYGVNLGFKIALIVLVVAAAAGATYGVWKLTRGRAQEA